MPFGKCKIAGRKKEDRFKVHSRYVAGKSKEHRRNVEGTSKERPRYGEAIQMVAKEFIIENSQFIIAEDLWRTIIIRIILLVDTK